MSADLGRALGAIRRLGANADQPIGNRLRHLDAIVAAAEQERKRLTMQLGMDMAKYLMAEGIEPSGRPVGEILSERDVA